MRSGFAKTLQVSIVFLVVAGILVLSFGGYARPVTAPVTGSLVVAQTWFAGAFQTIQSFLTAPSDLLALRARNAQLESQIAQLQSDVIALEAQSAESSTLAALVDFSRAHPGNEYRAASVIGRDPSPFMQYIIINRGSGDGLARGMPVVTNRGLVGRVDAVLDQASRVQLITDLASSVNVHLKTSNTDGVLRGSVTGDLVIDSLSQDIEIQVGDIVLTSGLGGGFPPDLVAGQVAAVRRLPAELFQQAALQPAVDFQQLQIVLVISNFRSIDASPLVPAGSP